MRGERMTAANVRRIAFWACIGAAFPLVPWWITMGADWFAKTYVCGPMPAKGFPDPLFRPWFSCVSLTVFIGIMSPICASAAAGFAWLSIRSNAGCEAIGMKEGEDNV